MGDGVQEATSAQFAEIRGRAERVLLSCERSTSRAVQTGWVDSAAALAHDVVALVDQVAELRATLKATRAELVQPISSMRNTNVQLRERGDAALAVVNAALARLSQFESALTPGRLGRLVS